MNRRAFILSSAALGATSCGYRVAGKADLMPKEIHSIGIPPFTNPTTRYRLTERLPVAITREFLARTKYQILPDATGADAVLQGSISMVMAYPTVFDPTSGRAAGVQVQTILAVTLTQAITKKVLYNNPSLDFRQRYEISTDPQAYFDESTSAFERLSRDVASSVVTAILENF
ncbi:MAG: LPS assembly lipoprotein LptE [Acidobacteria bacterium]|nr:LPS assembly lipoprotein LptE [Acidobacteriota bacterium]